MFFRGHKEARRTTDSGSSDPEQLLLDGLSGLYQTWYFERRANEEVARCARYGHHFGLVLWEPRLLPGEALADEVISKAGQVISSGIRKTDLAGRLDRTRFAALLFEAGFDVVRSVNHRVKVDLGQGARTGSGPWRGAFAVFPDDGLDYDVLLQVAGRRLNEDVSSAAA